LQHAGRAAAETRRVLAQPFAATAGFDADQLDARVRQKGVEDADGVRTAADAGENASGRRPSASRICRRASSPITF
jgi:hypothetical protein